MLTEGSLNLERLTLTPTYAEAEPREGLLEVRGEQTGDGLRQPHHISSGHLPTHPSFWAGAQVEPDCSVTALGTKPTLSSSGRAVLSPSHAVTQFYNYLRVSEVNPAFQSISREKIYEILIFRNKNNCPDVGVTK